MESCLGEPVVALLRQESSGELIDRTVNGHNVRLSAEGLKNATIAVSAFCKSCSNSNASASRAAVSLLRDALKKRLMGVSVGLAFFLSLNITQPGDLPLEAETTEFLVECLRLLSDEAAVLHETDDTSTLQSILVLLVQSLAEVRRRDREAGNSPPSLVCSKMFAWLLILANNVRFRRLAAEQIYYLIKDSTEGPSVNEDSISGLRANLGSALSSCIGRFSKSSTLVPIAVTITELSRESFAQVIFVSCLCGVAVQNPKNIVLLETVSAVSAELCSAYASTSWQNYVKNFTRGQIESVLEKFASDLRRLYWNISTLMTSTTLSGSTISALEVLLLRSTPTMFGLCAQALPHQQLEIYLKDGGDEYCKLLKVFAKRVPSEPGSIKLFLDSASQSMQEWLPSGFVSLENMITLLELCLERFGDNTSDELIYFLSTCFRIIEVAMVREWASDKVNPQRYFGETRETLVSRFGEQHLRDIITICRTKLTYKLKPNQRWVVAADAREQTPGVISASKFMNALWPCFGYKILLKRFPDLLTVELRDDAKTFSADFAQTTGAWLLDSLDQGGRRLEFRQFLQSLLPQLIFCMRKQVSGNDETYCSLIRALENQIWRVFAAFATDPVDTEDILASETDFVSLLEQLSQTDVPPEKIALASRVFTNLVDIPSTVDYSAPVRNFIRTPIQFWGVKVLNRVCNEAKSSQNEKVIASLMNLLGRCVAESQPTDVWWLLNQIDTFLVNEGDNGESGLKATGMAADAFLRLGITVLDRLKEVRHELPEQMNIGDNLSTMLKKYCRIISKCSGEFAALEKSVYLWVGGMISCASTTDEANIICVMECCNQIEGYRDQTNYTGWRGRLRCLKAVVQYFEEVLCSIRPTYSGGGEALAEFTSKLVGGVAYPEAAIKLTDANMKTRKAALNLLNQIVSFVISCNNGKGSSKLARTYLISAKLIIRAMVSGLRLHDYHVVSLGFIRAANAILENPSFTSALQLEDDVVRLRSLVELAKRFKSHQIDDHDDD